MSDLGIIRNDFVDDIILDPTEIAREYVKTWFFLDLISSIPMDYVLFAFKGYEQGERAEHLVQAGKVGIMLFIVIIPFLL
ncbi:unnamed protein product [Trichobilharzia regenti]|nr:unnamed protein product [Trichobilharzia regenti]